ncbi:MAG: Na/Pi symporter [Synergistaceae bacterium]|jgi:Na+/phosphate symporter|nr:Na/Pi symporter [Synergistaceae bacterium]
MSPYFYNAVNLLGGLCLFLYGVSQATEAFRSAFSSRARDAMGRFVTKKPHAMLFGAVLAAVAQGSTVSTSIAISFADAGMMTLTESAVVMMGASVGGTFVTFLVSLDVAAFSPLLLAASFTMVRLGRGWVQKTGNALHAISLILIGMLLLNLGAKPLLADSAVRGAVVEIARRPFTMFAAAFLGTAVLQSSASVMAIAVAIAASGVLSSGAIFPVALGAHLGSAVTMLLAAAGGRYNARVLGMATFLYKLAGVVAAAPLAPWANALFGRLGLHAAAQVVLAQIAVVCFNAVIFYPCPHILIRGGAFALSRVRAAGLGEPAYLDDETLEIPSLAVRLLTREMVRLFNYIEAFLQMRLCPERGEGALKRLLPDGIEELAEACERYMYAIRFPSAVDDPAAGREYRTIACAMLSLRETSRVTTGQFRELVDRYGIGELAGEMGKREWDEAVALFMQTVRDAFHAFSLGDAGLARRAAEKGEKFSAFALRLRAGFLAGLSEGTGKENSGLMDFLGVAERLLRSAVEIAHGDIQGFSRA